MNTVQNRKMKNKVAVFLLLLVSVVLMAGIPVKAAESVSVWLPVKQTLKGTADADEKQAFEYKLIPLESGNSMPEGATEDEYTVTLEGNQERTIQIDFNRAGTYTYRFFQVTDASLEEYTCDTEQYTVTVYIKAGDGGNLISRAIVTKQSDGMKVSDMEFINARYPESASVQNEDNPAQANVRDAETAVDSVTAAAAAAGTVNNAAVDGGDQEPADGDAQELKELGSEEVPRGLRNTDYWAVLNLVFAVATAIGTLILSIVYLKKKREENEEEDRKRKSNMPLWILSLVVSVASVVFFFLTEDVTLPTRWVDQYTWIMVAGLLIQVVDMVYIQIRGKKDNEEQVEKN